MKELLVIIVFFISIVVIWKVLKGISNWKEEKSREKIRDRIAKRQEESRRRIAEYNSRVWKDTPLRDRVQKNMQSSASKRPQSSPSSTKSSRVQDDTFYVPHTHHSDCSRDDSSSSSDYSGGGGDSGGGGSSGDW